MIEPRLFQQIAPDDSRLVVIRRDFIGGINTRQHASQIKENQGEDLDNVDIMIPGEIRKISGLGLIEDVGNNAGTGVYGFEPIGGTNELLVTEGTSLWGYVSPVTGISGTAHKADFTTGLQTTMLKAVTTTYGDVLIVTNGTDNVFQMEQDYDFSDCLDTNTSPPKTKVYEFYRNRLWALKNNLLYWSDALPTLSGAASGYVAAWDRTTNNFKVTVGQERAIVSVRDMGLICLGSDAVYGINPSVTPIAEDIPEKILDIGCVANKTAKLVGDDVLFLAADGVRGVFRTQADKLQLGQTFPLSYPLKTQFETISWAYITKASAVYFDNKYFLALPVNSSTYNNQVWVFYPALQSWITIDWNVADWAVLTVEGEEQLFAVDSNDGKVYRAWYGTTNNGTAISSVITGREEDCGQPLNYKNGGELEITAETAGNDDTLTVSVAIDGRSFSVLGTVSLQSGTTPTLPATLPFTLADSFVIRDKFHLDALGRWKTIQIKIENSDDNTDPIIVYGYNLVTFLEEYETE